MGGSANGAGIAGPFPLAHVMHQLPRLPDTLGYLHHYLPNHQLQKVLHVFIDRPTP